MSIKQEHAAIKQEEDIVIPPPSSQSHFAKFENFEPDNDASFDHEFARLASSQQWVPGSQQYTRERTIAMSQEIKLHEEEKLEGYQSLCREVRIPPSDSIEKCKKELKNTLVNIVDLIDARRTHKEVKVWHDFDAFRAYTLEDEHRINMAEAKKDGGYLATLLQRLGGPRGRRRRVRKAPSDRSGSKVVSGRVMKTSPV